MKSNDSGRYFMSFEVSKTKGLNLKLLTEEIKRKFYMKKQICYVSGNGTQFVVSISCELHPSRAYYRIRDFVNSLFGCGVCSCYVSDSELDCLKNFKTQEFNYLVNFKIIPDAFERPLFFDSLLRVCATSTEVEDVAFMKEFYLQFLAELEEMYHEACRRAEDPTFSGSKF